MKFLYAAIFTLTLAVPAATLARDNPSTRQSQQNQSQHSKSDMQAKVRGNVLPLAAGIKSAQASAAALQEMAANEPLDHGDARSAAELAEQGVDVAQESAENLTEIEGIKAQTDAQAAAEALSDAHDTVEEIQRAVGFVRGPFQSNEAQKVRDLSAQLSRQLQQAQQSMQKVADNYGISTDLEPVASTGMSR